MGVAVEVLRNDEASVQQVINRKPKAIFLSPGPCAPESAGICLDLLRENAGGIPMLGVCLGHQAIAQAYGGRVVRAPEPVHGKTHRVRHGGHRMFAHIPEVFSVVRYHSLIAERASLPAELEVTAETDDAQKLIMAVAHRTHPVYGVQFHPESYAAEHGDSIFAAFLREAGCIG